MLLNKMNKSRYALWAAPLSVIVLSTGAQAQERNIAFDSLSLIEEPLAKEIGDVTYSLRGTIDAPITFDYKNRNIRNYGISTAFQFGAETQLKNALRLGANYTVLYDYDNVAGSTYNDKYSIFAGGPMGTVFGGKVGDVLRMETDRRVSVGNADLAFATNLGVLNDLNVAYLGTFGPTQVGGVIDKDANFELGMIYQRPHADQDHKYSVRFTDGNYNTADGTLLRASSAQAVIERVYGSTKMNVGLGYELLTKSNFSANRAYVSGGASHKIGAYTMSLEGHYGEINGEQEILAAFGGSYDFARGASVNVGVNYKEAQVTTDGVQILNDKDTTAKLSLRYGF
tara:strand:+ start:141 stop:1163 length:1023 start_codon:yes stop_codon:yes gene_type:complete